MLPSQKRILELLQQEPISYEQLIKKTGLSPDGTRGRISELRRHHGFDIKKINGKYVLSTQDGTNKDVNTEKLISHLSEWKLYGQKLNVDQLASDLQMSQDDLETVLIKLFKEKRILQFKKDIVIIFEYDLPI